MVPITKLPLSDGSSKLETDEENFTFLQHHPRFHPFPEELVISNRERISGRNVFRKKKKRTNETLQEAYIMNGKNLGSFSGGEGQAEDLNVNFFDKKMEEDFEGAANPDASSSSQQLDHNYTYSRVVDSDLRVKDYLKPDDVSRPTPVLESEESLQNHNSNPEPLLPHNPPNETLQWEDLSMCDAHRYGWTLTPNLNNEIPSNYIEWVLFEGQLFRDGQRVFRELKIYDDWTVAIHAMGKKVHPDELGGITDLSRTRKSVAKVFATLAGARSCRGCPALSLSDLSVHGVVVAKTEIWSSRENNCEELRHRAINCQVLYGGNEESCPKCTRVIQMHSQNTLNLLGYNGYSYKESRFNHGPNTSV